MGNARHEQQAGGDREKPKRIFIAVNLPEDVRKEIYERLSMNIPKKGCKVVDGENLHVTMRFIGYVDEGNLRKMVEKLQALKAMKRFSAGISGVGHFNYRVLWLGISPGAEEMQGISEIMGEALGSGDERFHPHVTLARNKDLHRAEFGAVLKTLEKEGYRAEFTVESVDVMQSVLSPKGPEYSVVERIELDGGQ